VPVAASYRYGKLWYAIGWVLVLTVVVLSLMPSAPDIGTDNDKANHLLAYGTLMFWFGMLASRRRIQAGWALGFVAMGVALEYAQGMTEYRTFEVADMAADAIGVLIGWGLALTPARNLLWLLDAQLRGSKETS
jgi:VanZ family protein